MIIREPSTTDVKSLHQLILDSTRQQSTLTEASLSENLFNLKSTTRQSERKCTDPGVEFDLELVKSNTPAVKAFVAEVQDRLIGYVLYRYHYSPWMGHSKFIIDTFVMQEYRRKNIARQLVDKVFLVARQEGLSNIVMIIHDYESSLRLHLLKTHKLEWYRSNKTDWSVYRLNY